MKIGIDFDSTVAKIDQPWLDRLNTLRNSSYRAEDWLDWELSFLRSEDRPLFFKLFTPDIYRHVLPYAGAQTAIKILAGIPNVELVCVTSNPSNNSDAFTEAKKSWLLAHIPELSETVIPAKDKFGLGLDILIDDAPHHHKHADCTTVLVRRPWNQTVHSCYAFSEWSEGTAIIKEIIQNPHR